MLGGWDSRRRRSNKGGRLSQSQCVCSAAARWVFHDYAAYARRLGQPPSAPSAPKKPRLSQSQCVRSAAARWVFHDYAAYARRLGQPPSHAKKTAIVPIVVRMLGGGSSGFPRLCRVCSAAGTAALPRQKKPRRIGALKILRTELDATKRSSYALVIRPALIALTQTHMRLTSPLGSLTRMR